jgi:hypothetical protein
MLSQGDLPGLGNTIERLAQRVEVEKTETDKGSGEYLTIEIGG